MLDHDTLREHATFACQHGFWPEDTVKSAGMVLDLLHELNAKHERDHEAWAHFAPVIDRLRSLGASVQFATKDHYVIRAELGHLLIACLSMEINEAEQTAQIGVVHILGLFRHGGRRPQHLAALYLPLAEEWARLHGAKTMNLSATQDGLLAWRHMRPRALLKPLPTVVQEWELSYPGRPFPATVGEMPAEYAATCGGYRMEWGL